MPEYVTKSDFTKQMGVRPSAVTNALKRGAITTVLVNGREMIEPVAARAQWEEYSRPSPRRSRGPGRNLANPTPRGGRGRPPYTRSAPSGSAMKQISPR